MVYWLVGCLDPETFAAAEKAGTVDRLPANHAADFAPAIEPTLHTFWPYRDRDHAECRLCLAHPPGVPVMTSLAVGPLTDLLDIAGTLAFALSGAVSGARRGMDIFGVIVLAFVTAVAGGIVRDVLIGSLPPDALRT
ncbi:MAG TPA: TRIC cation channel family protein, partial [Acetobacteraceae bacterium]